MVTVVVPTLVMVEVMVEVMVTSLVTSHRTSRCKVRPRRVPTGGCWASASVSDPVVPGCGGNWPRLPKSSFLV